MFQSLYEIVMRWAKHRNAPRYLCALSFAESSFFPIPPDVMLAPMALATPNRAYMLALLTTVFSVLGGIFGYGVGYFIFDSISPYLAQTGYWHDYQRAIAWFGEWGFYAVLIAGFSPIPYKVFTIAAGVMQMLFPVFVLASLLGRGLRFFMLALLARLGGEKLEAKLHQHISVIGWATVAVLLLGVAVYSGYNFWQDGQK